ncbi:hypothetical protein ASD62_17710 [Phycicoccus sp. Root563]|uniref:DUF6221 family protein n=1 Tax=Phycicoccus sp. Root563 TaxID=1736562 RepID=UPI000702580E|nr:DUF6221 family protein [Phycicoccus sp. Root563]KQZ87422.1 hypothetical protein ASD62_17710 [Phycicoccus sp. Root563]
MGIGIDEFLEKRVRDDERLGREALAKMPTEDSRLLEASDGRVSATGWRILRDAALKREMIFSHDDYLELPADGRPPVVECVTCRELYPCQSLRIAVAVYADHPTYNPAWRPFEPDTRAD